MPARYKRVPLIRTAAYGVFAAVWGLALLMGLGHALYHQDGSCSLCVTMSTQAKSVEAPVLADVLEPPADTCEALGPVMAMPCSMRIPTSERLRAPPPSR